METIEVIIVGAGPSGSALAYLLKKNRINCLLVDKAEFPREKLCGGLVTKKTANLFKTIYCEDFTHYVSKAHTIKLYNKGELLVTSALENELYFIDRLSFDNYLLQKYIEIGGRAYTNTKIREIDINNKEVLINGKKMKYKILVGADGAHSDVRKYLDANFKVDGFCVETINDNVEKIKDVAIHFGIIEGGYGWVFPKNNKLAIGYGSNKSDRRQMTKEFVAYTNFVGSHAKNRRAAFIPYGNYIKHPCKNDIILVGDAAGLVDPLTGEGLYFSFESSFLASKTIINYLHFNKSLNSYNKNIRVIHKKINRSKLLHLLLLSTWGQELFIPKIKGHSNFVKYFADNAISFDIQPYRKLVCNYFKEKRENNGSR